MPPGDYTVAVAGTGVSAAVSVQAGQQASVTLVVPANPDVEALKRQIAALQAQVAQLQQQLAQAAADRDRYSDALRSCRSGLIQLRSGYFFAKSSLRPKVFRLFQ